jgi:predicted enzyme related to lactoylglutathione lyase
LFRNTTQQQIPTLFYVWFTVCADTENNTFALWESKEG